MHLPYAYDAGLRVGEARIRCGPAGRRGGDALGAQADLPKLEELIGDATKPSDLSPFIRGSIHVIEPRGWSGSHDLIISLLPWTQHLPIAKLAIKVPRCALHATRAVASTGHPLL
jgi:hypothetical protein